MAPGSGADMVPLAPAPAPGGPGAAASYGVAITLPITGAFERKTGKDQNSDRGAVRIDDCHQHFTFGLRHRSQLCRQCWRMSALLVWRQKRRSTWWSSAGTHAGLTMGVHGLDHIEA